MVLVVLVVVVFCCFLLFRVSNVVASRAQWQDVGLSFAPSQLLDDFCPLIREWVPRMSSFSSGPNRALFKLLQSLHAQIDSPSTDASLSPYRNLDDTLDGLASVALATTKSDRRIDVELCTSVLFVSNSPPNLLSFIRKSLKSIFFENKVVIDARVQAFAFIREYFDAVCHGSKRSEMARAAELVVQVSVEAFKRERSSVSKIAALDVLLEAIKSAPVSVQRVQARKHLDALFNDYALGRTGKSKSSDTLQSKILRVMGLLGREFPASIAPHAKQVVDSCVHVLRANFTGDKKPVHVLLAGAIACLKYLVFDYGDLFLTDKKPKTKGGSKPKSVEELYDLIFERGIVMYAEMKQYHVTRESLQFVAAHVGLFRNYLVSRTVACRRPNHAMFLAITPVSFDACML